LATDAATIYNLCRRLIATRRLRSSVNWMLPTDAAAGDLLLFVRRHEDERTLVALNFGSEPLAASFTAQALQILMSTLSDRVGGTGNGEVSGMSLTSRGLQWRAVSYMRAASVAAAASAAIAAVAAAYVAFLGR
jgi:hypothetical protein